MLQLTNRLKASQQATYECIQTCIQGVYVVYNFMEISYTTIIRHVTVNKKREKGRSDIIFLLPFKKNILHRINIVG